MSGLAPFVGTAGRLVELGPVGYEFQLADGFDMRWEYRRDISNRPIFLTNEQNIYSTHQDTATMGVIWWFGRKQGPW